MFLNTYPETTRAAAAARISGQRRRSAGDHAPVEAADRLQPARAVLLHGRHEHGEQGRQEQQGVDERPEQGEGHGGGHRPEHAALHALEAEQGHVDQHDDGDRKGDRADDALDRADVGLDALVGAELLADVAGEQGLEHDDRAVDEEAEVDGAERHEVAGDAGPVHAEQGDGHRGGDADDADEGAADAAEEDHEDDEDDDGALDQVGHDGGEGALDEVGAVVDRLDEDAGGEALLDLGDAVLDGVDDVAAVGAEQHHDDAGDGLVLAVVGDDAVAEGGAVADGGDVLDEDGLALGGGLDDDVADVFEAGEGADGAEGEGLGAAVEVAAGDDAAGALEGVGELADREVVGGEPGGLDDHLKLLEVATHGVDLDDAGDAAQARDDLPVEHGAQLLARVDRGADDELVDLAEAGGERGDLRRRDVGREVPLGLQHALEDQLAGEPRVGAVLKDDRDRGDVGAGHRAQLDHPGHAVEGVLHREGDVAFDLQGGQTGRVGEDRDLDARDVGDGVDGERASREHAACEEHPEQREHHVTQADGEVDQRGEHGRGFIGTARTSGRRLPRSRPCRPR
nr:hypothetical protein [Nannocystis sp.]